MKYIAAPVDSFDAVFRELQKIALTLQGPEVQFLGYAQYYTAPARPFEGMTVKADGATWNPGAGAGVYVYRGGAWNLLG